MRGPANATQVGRGSAADAAGSGGRRHAAAQPALEEPVPDPPGLPLPVEVAEHRERVERRLQGLLGPPDGLGQLEARARALAGELRQQRFVSSRVEKSTAKKFETISSAPSWSSVAARSRLSKRRLASSCTRNGWQAVRSRTRSTSAAAKRPRASLIAGGSVGLFAGQWWTRRARAPVRCGGRCAGREGSVGGAGAKRGSRLSAPRSGQ